MNIEIQQANDCDIDAILDIQRTTDETHWSAALFHASIEKQHCWVARAQQQVAGFAVFSYLLDEAELLNIAVAPLFQRQGIASRLFSTVALLLKAQGIRQCFLEVADSNRKAQLLYQKLGFETVSIRKNYYQRSNGVDDAIVMRSEL